MEFAGIKRAKKFSPNHMANDSMIITRTAEELEKLGAKVVLYDEELLTEGLIKEKYIFNMVRNRSSIDKLKKMEDEGRFVINKPGGILNCYRENMASMLPAASVPFPLSNIIDTDIAEENIVNPNGRKLWVKRGDVHAVHREDVTLVYNEEERNSIIKEYERRDIKKAILQEHLDGDVIKFYAIRDTDFFYWYYLNGVNHTPFNEDDLQNAARLSSETLDVHIFGGDAIVKEDGSIHIIDLNDWPSFAPVREKVAPLIARKIYDMAEEFESR